MDILLSHDHIKLTVKQLTVIFCYHKKTQTVEIRLGALMPLSN